MAGVTWSSSLSGTLPGCNAGGVAPTATTDRSTDATYTVHHAGGSTQVTVDQQRSGGVWVPLGAFDMAPGQNHRVELSDIGNGAYIIADAVKFERASTFAGAIVVDGTHPLATVVGSWWWQTYTGGGVPYGGTYRGHANPDGSGSAIT